MDVDGRTSDFELDQRAKRYWSTILNIASNTTTHGVPRIVRSETWRNRIFWSLVFVAFATAMTILIMQSIIRYFRYPTQTNIQMSVERSQVFPAVTICNFGYARFDLFAHDYLNYTNSMNLTQMISVHNMTVEHGQYIPKFFTNVTNRNESIEKYLFSLEDILISCSYNGEICSKNDFILLLTPLHGACYTFNVKVKNASKLSLRQTFDNGLHGILTLQLYTHNHLYPPNIHQDVSAAIITLIHDNDELPMIDMNGMYIAPGKRHRILYKKKTNRFLGSPYSNCTIEIPKAMKMMYEHISAADYGYSQRICYNLCIQTFVYQECGCISIFQWVSRHTIVPPTDRIIIAPLCEPDNLCPTDASNKILKSTKSWHAFCSHCKPSCSVTEFIVTSSTANILPKSNAVYIKKLVEKLPVPLPKEWNTSWFYEVQSNYLSVEFVSQSNMIESYKQEASFGPIELVANVGGQSGLWLGISLLSVVECVLLLYYLLLYSACRLLCIVRNRIHTYFQ